MFRKTGKLITAIDISDDLLKIIAISNDNKGSSLSALDCISLSSDDEKAVAKEVRVILSKHKIAKSYFIISFPRHLVTIKSVRLPTTSESEIRNMAELQAIKYIPYSREEIVVSYKVISVTPEGYSDVLLVLAQKKLIDKYIAIFRHAGINIEKIALSSEGILYWYTRLGKEDSAPVAIIDVDRHHTHIQIIKDKNLFFTRSISFDAALGEQGRSALLREIRLSFDSYNKERNEDVTHIIVSGSEDYTRGMAGYLASNITLPCEDIAQLGGLKPAKTAEQSLNKLKGASYTALLGLALSRENIEINLIPHDILEKKMEQTSRRELFKSAVLLLCIFAAFFGIMEKKMLEKKFYLARLEDKISKIEPEVARLSKVKESTELINSQLMFEGSSIDTIRELYKILPKDISLTLFEFDDKDRILLRGTAKELSSVFNLLPTLEKSPYFENAKINYATKRTFKHTEFADFEIVCQMSKF